MKGTSKNSFAGRIVSSRCARAFAKSAHAPERTLRLLCSGLLKLHPQKRNFRGARNSSEIARARGMTLVEIMIALSIASLMTLTGWRALDTLQLSRDRVVNDAVQWQRLDDFFANLEADLRRASLSEFAANSDAIVMVQPSLSHGADTRRVSYRWLVTNERVEMFREAGGERLPVAEVQSISVAYSADGVIFQPTINAYPRAIRISVVQLTTASALPPVDRILALR